MLPVVGSPADAINAAWYAAEGDYLNAGLSAVGMLPGIGEVAIAAKATIAAAAAGIAFKSLDEAIRWIKKWIDDAGLFAKNGGEAVEIVEEGASRLIGADRAIIDPGKLTNYALNPTHPVGKNKARVFESALGFNQSNADDLLRQIQEGVTKNTPSPGKVDEHGTRFSVDIPVTGPKGTAVVRTAWIYTPGSTTPRLVTLLVK